MTKFFFFSFSEIVSRDFLSLKTIFWTFWGTLSPKKGLLNIYPFKGLLYSLVRTYEEVGLREEALTKVKNWLMKDPNDEDIKLLYEYLLEMNSYQ